MNKKKGAILLLLGWISLLVQIGALSISMLDDTEQYLRQANKKAMKEARKRQQQ